MTDPNTPADPDNLPVDDQKDVGTGAPVEDDDPDNGTTDESTERIEHTTERTHRTEAPPTGDDTDKGNATSGRRSG